jgi:hypothetical protein
MLTYVLFDVITVIVPRIRLQRALDQWSIERAKTIRRLLNQLDEIWELEE